MVVVGVYFDFSVTCMQYNVTKSGIYLLYQLYNLNNEFPYLCVCFYHSAVMRHVGQHELSAILYS